MSITGLNIVYVFYIVASLCVFIALACIVYAIKVKRRIEQLNITNSDERQRLEQTLSDIRIEYAVLNSKYQAAMITLSERNIALEKQEKYQTLYLKANANFEALQKQNDLDKTQFNETKQALLKEVELSASTLLDSKKDKLEESNKANIQQVLTPLKQQIAAFNQKLDENAKTEALQRGVLSGHIIELQKQANTVADEANNLAKALTGDSQIQGRWGEVVLERILEQSGLEEGREYKTQQTFKTQDSKLLRPDVVIYLPQQRQVVVDAKVSLTAYERYINSDEPTIKKTELKSHVVSLKSHIKSLAEKKYTQIESVGSLGFVLMFIPIDLALALAVKHDKELFRYAYDQQVLLVTPTSFFISLKTIESVWQKRKQTDNAKEIADSAGKLYDQFALFMESFEDIGLGLDKAVKTYQKSKGRLISGRGNILGKMTHLKELGANTSRNVSKEKLTNPMSS